MRRLVKVRKESGLEEKEAEGPKRAFIVQRYIDKPLLVHGRKFDIRVFVLLVARDKGTALDGYCYSRGYVRTSVKSYSSDPAQAGDLFVHLTNDAVSVEAFIVLLGSFRILGHGSDPKEAQGLRTA